MDQSLTPAEVAIAACGAVTALGCGVSSLERAVATNAGCLLPCARYAGKGYQTDVVGSIGAETWEEIDAKWPGQPGSSANRLAMTALVEAIGQVRPLLDRLDPARIALVLSTTKADVLALESAMKGSLPSPEAGGHILPGQLAAGLARASGVRGPVQCVSLACVSGLLALRQGCRMIRRGQADAALVVGVDVLSHFVLYGFSALKSLAPSGCRPFDKDRNGLSLGEGAGAVVLVRSDLHPSAGVIMSGSGSSNDANHLTGPSRDGSGLAAAMRRALRDAGLPAERIEYVNAHGTGTVYNDAMEAFALRAVFGENVPPFSSSKGLIGHTLGAAGIIETIICWTAMRSGVLPGTPGLEIPDPAVPRQILAGPRPGTPPRCVMKINAGFGGVNGAIVLEARRK